MKARIRYARCCRGGSIYRQRANVHGIASERADVIVGGLLPLMAILRQLDVKQLTFSNNGLREGLMFKFLDHEIMSSIVQPLTD